MPDTSYSLLERLRADADPASWERLVSVYTPLLQTWLRRYQVFHGSDVEDLTQDVLLAVARDLPLFRPDRNGAFRAWLRAILVNRLRHFWRSRQHRPAAVGGSDFLEQIEQLSDNASQMSQLWDQEHDRQVMQRLLGLVEPQFTAATWMAFRRQALDGVPAEAVAAELHMAVHSVYAAKSRVLKALRTMAAGLITQ